MDRRHRIGVTSVTPVRSLARIDEAIDSPGEHPRSARAERATGELDYECLGPPQLVLLP
jgi:hypothetical protein